MNLMPRMLRPDRHAPIGLYCRYGYVINHALPWETYRVGEIVERPLEGLGHTVICGATNTGKTVASYAPIWYSTVGAGWGSIMVDFKASAKTQAAMAACAKGTGKPLVTLKVGTTSPGETPAFYDPFAWEGTAEEKASMLLSCFDMTTEGAAAYYSSIAETWLRFEFHLLDYMRPNEGESTMDFLVRMCTRAEAVSAVKKVARENPQAGAALEYAMGTTIGDKDLAGLRSQLNNILAPLRPNLTPGGVQDGRPVFDPWTLADKGGLAYVSISAANESVVKGVGTLVLQHLTSIMQVRMRHPGGAPMLITIDEASALGEKATVVETLLKQAREAEMWVTLATQQLSAWPESVQTAILGNASTIIALRADDAMSAAQLSANAGFGTQEINRRSTQAATAVGGERQTIGGEQQRSVEPGHPLLEPSEFQALAPHTAYIWFRSMPGIRVGSGRNQRCVPATPRHWTRNHRLTRGWESNFTYDIPVVQIVAPTPMLEAAESVSDGAPITPTGVRASLPQMGVPMPAGTAFAPARVAPTMAAQFPTLVAPAGAPMDPMGDQWDDDDMEDEAGSKPLDTHRNRPAQKEPTPPFPGADEQDAPPFPGAPVETPTPVVEVLEPPVEEDEVPPESAPPASPAWGAVVDDD